MTYIQITEVMYRCTCCGKLVICQDENLLPIKCPHCGEE